MSLFFKSDNSKKIFPTPKYLTLDPVALEINCDSIKIVKLKKSNPGLIPKIIKEYKFQNEYYIYNINKQNDVDPSKIKYLIDTLKKAKKELNLEYIYTTIPELNTYIFKITLPKEARDDIADAVKFRLEENVPLNPEEVNFDYSIVKDERYFEEDSDFDVVVNVFPQKTINVYKKILQMAGLVPISIFSESVSLMRAVIDPNDKEPYLLINLLKDRIAAHIVNFGNVENSFSIMVRPENIISDFESKDAVELKESLNKLLIFWFTSKQDDVFRNKIETVIICGDFAYDPKLEEFLERNLKINVLPADVWKNCFDLNNFIPEIEFKDSLKFGSTIGLAIMALNND